MRGNRDMDGHPYDRHVAWQHKTAPPPPRPPPDLRDDHVSPIRGQMQHTSRSRSNSRGRQHSYSRGVTASESDDRKRFCSARRDVRYEDPFKPQSTASRPMRSPERGRPNEQSFQRARPWHRDTHRNNEQHRSAGGSPGYDRRYPQGGPQRRISPERSTQSITTRESRGSRVGDGRSVSKEQRDEQETCNELGKVEVNYSPLTPDPSVVCKNEGKTPESEEKITKSVDQPDQPNEGWKGFPEPKPYPGMKNFYEPGCAGGKRKDVVLPSHITPGPKVTRYNSREVFEQLSRASDTARETWRAQMVDMLALNIKYISTRLEVGQTWSVLRITLPKAGIDEAKKLVKNMAIEM
ncbi:uncharacterized protein BcabD6B2_35490 [Babesia caballi]|uniref:Uncharacterized protein n=1 Tax=Babesia caballi TaxID=5871 RepID=A0AAV4LWF1_BABCB|nr:hypothetical protein, conserved [Babesia caballi]